MRLSDYVRDMAQKADDWSGLCFSAKDDIYREAGRRLDRQIDPAGPRSAPPAESSITPGMVAKILFWRGGDGVLTGVAQGLELLVAKPLYHVENLVVGKAEQPRSWLFS